MRVFKIVKNDVFSSFGKESAITVKYNKGPVYYLLSQRGEAMEIHVSATSREGKRLIREASSAVIQWVEHTFPWCKMLIAPVNIKSVYNLCKKIGFVDLGKGEFENGLANIMVIDYVGSR